MRDRSFKQIVTDTALRLLKFNEPLNMNMILGASEFLITKCWSSYSNISYNKDFSLA